MTLTRFWNKVKESPSGCWEWTGCLNKEGCYGVFWHNHKSYVAHRFLYESINGAVPEGFELDHLCKNKKCVNPNHLEVVTRRVNALRGKVGHRTGEIQKAKTHCRRGHPYDEANTYFHANGARGCRLCREIARNKWRQNHEVSN